MNCLRFSVLLILVILLASSAGYAAPPDWLLNAAGQATPALAAGAPALVLLDETVVTIRPDGGEVTERRFAVRMLNRSGRDQARGVVSYLDKDEKVDRSEAWLVRSGKEIRPPMRRNWADVSAAGEGAVYSENRARAVSYSDLALDGDVFGFETKVTGRLQFSEQAYAWASQFPVLTERFSLVLPPGWSTEGEVIGPRAAAVALASGVQRWSWTLKDLAYRPDEPWMADLSRMDARLLVRLSTPAGGKNAPIRFGTWSDVRDWALRLQDGQCDTSPSLVGSVRELTATCPDPLAKMRALSRQVQTLRYVAVDKDLAKGFGCRPRKASEVEARGWGDCKDKANLLRAMLREVGIESHMAVARLGGGRELNDAWPSPSQFNHAILAIRVDDAVVLPGVVATEKWGRVLFFDPTDSDTLLGNLPAGLQGTKVFLLAPGADALITLPSLPLETCHVLDRRVQLELDRSGAIVGECSYGGPGSAGAYYRRRVRTTSAKDLRTSVTERLNGTVRGAVLADFHTSDDPLTGECRFHCRFAAPRFAQLMPGGLMVVRLDVLSRDAAPAFPALDRKVPVGLTPLLQRDEVTLTLPSGFVAEELPDKAMLSSPYGSYESTYEVAEGTIIARRMLRIEDRNVPVGEYGALRKFLGEVAKADHSSVVLRQAEPASVAGK